MTGSAIVVLLVAIIGAASAEVLLRPYTTQLDHTRPQDPRLVNFVRPI